MCGPRAWSSWAIHGSQSQAAPRALAVGGGSHRPWGSPLRSHGRVLGGGKDQDACDLLTENRSEVLPIAGQQMGRSASIAARRIGRSFSGRLMPRGRVKCSGSTNCTRRSSRVSLCRCAEVSRFRLASSTAWLDDRRCTPFSRQSRWSAAPDRQAAESKMLASRKTRSTHQTPGGL